MAGPTAMQKAHAGTGMAQAAVAECVTYETLPGSYQSILSFTSLPLMLTQSDGLIFTVAVLQLEQLRLSEVLNSSTKG